MTIQTSPAKKRASRNWLASTAIALIACSAEAGTTTALVADRLIDGRKRFKGRVKGVNDDGEVLLLEGGMEFKVPFAAIAKAKLVLTDDLIAASSDKPKQ